MNFIILFLADRIPEVSNPDIAVSGNHFGWPGIKTIGKVSVDILS